MTSRYFKRGASGVEIEQFEDDDLFCLNLIDTGVAAYFAAVHPDHGIPVYQEMEFMLTTGADCGDTMKHSYDSVVMGNGGKALRCPRLEVGKPDPIDTPKAVMLYGTAARILFGDPAARPVVKPIPGPYKIKVQKKGKGFRAQVRLVNPAVKYSLQDTFHFHLSADKSQFNDRVYVRVPLPKKLADVSELSVSRAFAGSTNLEHELLCYAVEEWHGQRFLHVQIDFPTTGYQMSKMRTSDTTVWIDFR